MTWEEISGRIASVFDFRLPLVWPETRNELNGLYRPAPIKTREQLEKSLRIFEWVYAHGLDRAGPDQKPFNREQREYFHDVVRQVERFHETTGRKHGVFGPQPGRRPPATKL